MATATETKPKTDPARDDQTDEALFDKAHYDDPELRITKVDGQGIDKIRIGFGGSILLDRSNPKDVELYNKLTLGKDVELRIAGEVAQTAAGWTTNRDGDLDAIVGEKKVKVTQVWALDPESL